MDVGATAAAWAGCDPQTAAAPESLVAEGSWVKGVNTLAQPDRPGLQAKDDVEVDPGAAAPFGIDEVEEELLTELAVPSRAVHQGDEIGMVQRADAEPIVRERRPADRAARGRGSRRLSGRRLHGIRK